MTKLTLNKRTLLLVVFMTVSTPLKAEVDVNGDDQAIGRLFFLPEERHKMDEYRRNKNTKNKNTLNEPTASIHSEQEKGVLVERKLYVQGKLLRNQQLSNVWVNETQNLFNQSAVEDLKVKANKTPGELNLKMQTKQANVKVGQVWLLDEDRIAEAGFEKPKTDSTADSTPPDWQGRLETKRQQESAATQTAIPVTRRE